MSERRRRNTRSTTMLSEQRRGVKLARRLNNQIEGELARMQAWNAQQKRADATAFCDRLVSEGRATPALVKGALMPTLLALDNTRPAHRFTENGRTTALTAYELKKRELAQMPVVFKHGERLGTGGGTSGKPDGAAEEGKVRAFAETLAESALRAGGYKGREAFVQKFSEARKKNPELTAKEYLGT